MSFLDLDGFRHCRTGRQPHRAHCGSHVDRVTGRHSSHYAPALSVAILSAARMFTTGLSPDRPVCRFLSCRQKIIGWKALKIRRRTLAYEFSWHFNWILDIEKAVFSDAITFGPTDYVSIRCYNIGLPSYDTFERLQSSGTSSRSHKDKCNGRRPLFLI